MLRASEAYMPRPSMNPAPWLLYVARHAMHTHMHMHMHVHMHIHAWLAALLYKNPCTQGIIVEALCTRPGQQRQPAAMPPVAPPAAMPTCHQFT